jgi:hypothetical protein
VALFIAIEPRADGFRSFSTAQTGPDSHIRRSLKAVLTNEMDQRIVMQNL